MLTKISSMVQPEPALTQSTQLNSQNTDYHEFQNLFSQEISEQPKINEQSSSPDEQEIEISIDDQVTKNETKSNEEMVDHSAGEKQNTELSEASEKKVEKAETSDKKSEKPAEIALTIDKKSQQQILISLKELLNNQPNSGIQVLKTKSDQISGVRFKIKDLPSNLAGKVKQWFADLKENKISQQEFQGLVSQLLIQQINKKDGKNKTNLKLNVVVKSKDSQVKKGVVPLDLKNHEVTPQENKVPSLQSANKVEKSSDQSKVALKTAKTSKKAKLIEDSTKSETVSLNTKSDLVKEIKIDNPFIKNEGKAEQLTKSEVIQKTFADNKQQIFETIAKNTKITLSNAETHFSTMMRPDELGRIDLRFNVKDGKLLGRVILQNQEAADFFRSNVEELRAVFAKSNVEMEKLDVMVAGQMAGNFENEQSQQQTTMDQENNPVFIAKATEQFDENLSNNSMNYSIQQTSAVNIII